MLTHRCLRRYAQHLSSQLKKIKSVGANRSRPSGFWASPLQHARIPRPQLHSTRKLHDIIPSQNHFARSILFLISFSAWVEDQYPPDVPEPGSSEAIARDTTDPKYISSWVSYVPESKTVPSPSDYLGHIAGAAGELVSAQKIHAYMRELDKASDRVATEVIGNTEEGREILLSRHFR